jgi:GDP-L-fucose synthase
MENKKVLVTGGSGMVGCSLRDIMPNAIYLSSKDCDLTDPISVDSLIKYHRPDVIIHLAAKVGGIIDNINKPAEYFDDNVIMNTLLLKATHKYNVKRFIGILSTCIYPDKVETYPMTEDMLHEGPPTPTNFSYGYAKRCLGVQIDAYNQQYGTKYQYLTPCNLYGEFDKWGVNSHFVAALIKKIIIADRKGQELVQLFGTGKPLRQFMYSNDLARVIKNCIDFDITQSFNVATKENLSINDISHIALEAIQPKYVKGFVYDSTKPDGQYRKDVSIKKMENILPGFEFTPLTEGIRNTYKKIKDKGLF